MKDYTLKPASQSNSEHAHMNDVQRILALDLGIGSYGIALQERRGEGKNREFAFPIVRSCTLPGDWAELKEERTRRRMWRTRLAHIERESWLRQVFERCGLGDAVLWGRRLKKVAMEESGPGGVKVWKKRWMLDAENPPDYRLEREFPPQPGQKSRDGAPSDEKGSRTIYSGAALRCLLLLGEQAQVEAQGCPLEPWQIFKALHSAIQKRGYDAAVPWARTPTVKSVLSADGVSKKARKGKKTETETDAVTDSELVLSEAEVKEKKEEQASLERALTMKGIVEGLSPDARFQHPCFWEAYRMGLWDAAEPDVFQSRQTHDARSCKWADQEDPANKFKNANERDPYARLPAIFPRQMVEAELIALCEAAARQLPGLSVSAYEIAYGPTGMAYPNIPRRDPAKKDEEDQRRAALDALPTEQRKQFVRGKAAEWQGALSQKAPTFDNRGPAPCALIPRFNVAKCDLRFNKEVLVPDSALAAEISFLLQLKNFRFVPEVKDDTRPGGVRDSFSPKELKQLFEDHCAATVLARMTAGMTGGAMTKKMLCDWMGEHIGPKTTPKPGQDGKGKETIDMPKATGRARFSRPALRLVKELLLSGLSPLEFKAAVLDLSNVAFDALRKAVKLVVDDGGEVNTQEMRGMIAADLDFLDNIGASWDKISIRDERLEAIGEMTQGVKEVRQAAITRMISMEINPKIRHRLTLLDHVLDEITADGKQPDRVVLEFAREEWLGPKRKKELESFQKERREQNITARMNLGGEVSHKTVLKHQLLTEQGGRCLFCGKNFSNPKTTSVSNGELSFENAHLAHIVAASKGGPRAYVNLVLACDGCNRAQENRYHADAFAQNRFPLGWDTFVGLVSGCAGMRPFKKKILCTKSEDEAALMVQNKTALQETAWIAKLARVLICLKFGWKLDSEGEQRRIVVVTGSVTNRVASKFGLYALLGGPERVKKLADAKVAIESAIQQVESADDDELDKLCDEFPKEWKTKKRKGDARWDREAVCKGLRRLRLENEDAINEKDRGDARHHALDAMVLSFLPHWAGNPGKNLYFGLPPGRNWKEEFGLRLNAVQAESLRFEKPVLRETIYGLRQGDTGKFSAAIRREVFPMAYGGSTHDGKMIKFSVGNLRARLPNIRVKNIASLLLAIANDLDGIADLQNREKEWYVRCKNLRIKPNGALIKRVSCWSDKPEQGNYVNMSKDWTPEREAAGKGQWRCAKGSHKGQWVYLDALSKPRIRAVKVFESSAKVKSDLEADSDCTRVIMLLQSGCIVKIDGEVKSGAKLLTEGNYRVGGIEEAARKIDLYSAGGTKFEKIPLTSLLAKNFRRVH
jgi:CRISPR-associated endonuclease Csn1